MKRPTWVWIIFLSTIVNTALGAWGIYLLFTDQSLITEDLQKTVNSLKPVDYIISIITMLISLAAGTTLFMLRKIAYKLYWLVLVLIFVNAGGVLGFEGVSTKSVSAILYQMLIIVLIIGYTKRLIQANILR